MKAETPCYVYITGYGRSGSTIAELLLGEILPECVTFGEVRYVHNEYHSRDICSCGESRASCQFWGDQRLNDSVIAMNNQLDRSFPESEALHLSISSFIQRVSELRESEINFVVDSSKNATGAFLRPLKLLRVFKNTKVLFVYRPFRDVMKSIYKGYNREKVESKLFRGKFSRVVRSFLVYVLSYLVNSYLQLTGRALRVNYVDMIENYSATSIRILEYLGVDKNSFHENGQVVTGFNSHLISGNRLAKSLPMTIQKK
jgi:hypothetical protein